MKPTQPSLPLAMPRPKREPAPEYRLPEDYGEGDWTPREVPRELWIELIDGPKP